MMETHNARRATAILNLLLGIWIFVSPWVYRSYGNPNSWNSWVVGALIVILAAVRACNSVGSQPLAWISMILGAWIFFSPWIFAYTANTGFFINSLCAWRPRFSAEFFAVLRCKGESHRRRTRGSDKNEAFIE